MDRSIAQRQLTPEAGRLLRAYTAEYRYAKRYRAVRVSVGIVLAFLGPATELLAIDAGAVVAAVAGAWAIAGRLLLRPAEKRRVQLAARIQELFDTRVLDLPWSRGVAGDRPSEEDIADAARRVEEDERLTAAFEDGWYHPPPVFPIRWMYLSPNCRASPGGAVNIAVTQRSSSRSPWL